MAYRYTSQGKEYQKGMVKLSRNRLIVIMVLIVAVSALTYNLFMQQTPKPIYTWNYHGRIIGFRADLREAAKVPVYPNEQAVYLDTIHYLVKNVTIAFKDAGESENPYYILQEIELIKGLKLAYARKNISVSFNAMPVESYEHLPGKIQNPIIALVHPIYANETAIRNKGHVTYISGKTHEDFDLAVVKFLMIILRIDIEED